MKWIFVDEKGRVFAENPNDMSGNSGWVGVEDEVPKQLANTDGIPLFKMENGNIVTRNAAEVEADTLQTDHQPTMQEQMDTVMLAVAGVAKPEGTETINLYAMLVQKGLRTIDQVPAEIREAVEKSGVKDDDSSKTGS